MASLIVGPPASVGPSLGNTGRLLGRCVGVPLILVLLFLLIPIAEIYVIIQIGQVIGAWWTVLLLIAISVAGAWLVKREGRRVWRDLMDSTRSARMPTRELADAALVVVGGTLLVTPGFITDAIGLLIILPITRPAARLLLTAYIGRIATRRVGRVRVVNVGGPTMSDAYRPEPYGPGNSQRTVRGEVADP